MAKKANPVNWFEIPVTNMKRATRFYESVFGIRLKAYDMGAMKMTLFPARQSSPGAAGSLMKSKGYKPSRAGVVIYFHVPSISRTLAKVKAKGGKVLIRKTSIGEWGGFIAHFKDTEGNRVALHSMK